MHFSSDYRRPQRDLHPALVAHGTQARNGIFDGMFIHLSN